MTSYGGYQKPAYGAQGGDDSGGFMYGGSQQGSQGGGKGYQDESLRPVTIKQILDAEEAYPGADFKIDGATVTQVTFIGQVRAINPQATNITYKLDDGTATLEVKKWVDTDKKDDDLMDGVAGGPGSGSGSGVDLDAYVRVWGRIKSFNGKRHVGAHFLRAVTDFNEVNYHLLESTYVHLFFTKGPLGGVKAEDNGDGMFVDGGNNNNKNNNSNIGNSHASHATGQSIKVAQCTPMGQKMYNFLVNAPGGNEGVHMNVIASGAGMSMRDILGAADELLGQGLVYTTIDDETWAILEY
ncbi:hypothetical protein VD0004_g5463 [Verticillium dahliae]|uniref:Replication protein A C-terminal domain-containing protein n=1 Tax=Verticillium dahliae TaxID=27337 RepID=A0A444S2Q5_VERDA|nr:hypothetical protein VD0004_g5463 [Verticillium dahliae]PNH72263.1 hypothetical protein VD0001_g5276 [Verticillium dahliae]RXG47690.1 hypothetical protein VDGE_10269 [Verticillium dahliae]